MSRSDTYRALAALLRTQRWGSLATVGADGAPLASMTAYVAEPALDACLLHLSQLAAHTGNILAEPRIALTVGEPDDGRTDPQTLARATLLGEAHPLASGTEAHTIAQARYLERLPEAEQRFGFSDFLLFRLEVRECRFVGGFARAYTLDVDELRKAAALGD